MKEATRKLIVWVLLIGIAAPIVGAAIARLMHHEVAPLSQADRAALVDETVGGQRRLRHPTLGFSFQHPGPAFDVATEQIAQLRASQPNPGFQFYAYRDAVPTALVVVAIVDEEIDSRDDMSKELGGYEHSLDANVIDRAVLWDDTHHEARTHGTKAGLHFRSRLFALHPHGHEPVFVAFTVISKDPDTLTDVLASFTPS